MRPLRWLLLLCTVVPVLGKAQDKGLPAAPPPFRLHYTIYAKANNTARTITGMEKIRLTNLSGADIGTISLKLYPNAYSSDRTRYSEHLLKQRDLRFYFADSQAVGSITQLDFSVADRKLDWQYTDPTGENVQVHLPDVLHPGDSIEIQTSFLLKLPLRLHKYGYGYQKDNYMLSKWYPELAGWTQAGGWEDSTTFEGNQPPSLPADYSVFFTSSEQDKLWTSGELLQTRQGAHEDDGYDSESQQLSVFQLRNAPGFDMVVALHGSDLPLGFLHRENGGQTDTPFTDFSTQRSDSAERLFSQLLPGPLRAKRPEHPEKVLSQTRTQLFGVENQLHKPTKPAFLLNLKNADSVHYLSFLPAFGYNEYDKLMAGVMIHNYQLPLDRLNFLVAPMISTKNHQITGLANFDYRVPAADHLWEFSLNASRYSLNNYTAWTDGSGVLHPDGQLRLFRVVPAISFTKYREPGDFTKGWDLGIKTYILNTDKWLVTGNDLSMEKSTDLIGEIKAGLWDKRILYPYHLDLKVNGTKDYLRMGLTGKYFLNYDGEGNGLQMRGFAGKFFYLKARTSLDSYNFGNAFLSLSGVDGSHDYTYSNYFVGRSAYEGWMSQQLAVEDGFFKVSTPYLNDPVGISDDWLAAINLTTDIPKSINPFAVLPFRLPVRFFLDIGTYSQAWADNPSTGRFLYDAGLQVSVLKEAVTIYFPLLYSKIYRDTYKSMGYTSYFSHTIRFSINLASLKPRVLNRIFN